jgi:hypothetical protein
MTHVKKWMLGSVLAVATAAVPGVELAHRNATPAAAPRATLSVSISGGTDIQPNTQCYWWANVQGGTPPYTYAWSGGTALSGLNALEYSAYSASSFNVAVQVTDAANQRTSAFNYVIVDSSAGVCPY